MSKDDIVFGDDANIVTHKITDETIMSDLDTYLEPSSVTMSSMNRVALLLRDLFDLLEPVEDRDTPYTRFTIEGRELPDSLNEILSELMEAYDDGFDFYV